MAYALCAPLLALRASLLLPQRRPGCPGRPTSSMERGSESPDATRDNLAELLSRLMQNGPGTGASARPVSSGVIEERV
jgi:hypothetical protein